MALYAAINNPRHSKLPNFNHRGRNNVSERKLAIICGTKESGYERSRHLSGHTIICNILAKYKSFANIFGFHLLVLNEVLVQFTQTVIKTVNIQFRHGRSGREWFPKKIGSVRCAAEDPRRLDVTSAVRAR
jgi:hypothetical protein